jgi:hypothetical protein
MFYGKKVKRIISSLREEFAQKNENYKKTHGGLIQRTSSRNEENVESQNKT